MASTVSVEFTSRRSAAAPATCGVACDVPLNDDVEPFRPDDRIVAPGARMSNVVLASLKQVTRSATGVPSHDNGRGFESYTAPTEIALRMQAGEPIVVGEAVFPAHANTAVPLARKRLMTLATGVLN